MSNASSREARIETLWQPPCAGKFKINIDAALCVNSTTTKVSAVCRDSAGNVYMFAVSKRKAVQNPLQAELLAILFGLEMSLEQGFTCIQVESDSLVAVQEIRKRSDSLCKWGSLIADVCALSRRSEEFSLNHVKRAANRFAHNLANLPMVDDVDVLC
ncbi:hypothetical protein CRYUN_Cryun20dG0078000 [Craigia yunnanensis]